MPKVFAPRAMTITSSNGTGMTLKAGEIRTVGNALFAAALQQGAYPAPEEFTNPTAVSAPATAPPKLAQDRGELAKLTQKQGELAFVERPSLENATVVEEGDEDLPTEEELARYPTGAVIAETQVPTPPPPPPPPTLEDRVADAYRRIVARKDPADFTDSGVPKARALSKELNGDLVDLETREKVWELIAKEQQA